MAGKPGWPKEEPSGDVPPDDGSPVTLQEWGRRYGMVKKAVLRNFRGGKLPWNVGMPERLPMTVAEWGEVNGVSWTVAKLLWRGGYLDRFGLRGSTRKLPWWEYEWQWDELKAVNARRFRRVEELEGELRALRGEQKKQIHELVVSIRRVRRSVVHERVKMETAWKKIRLVQNARLQALHNPVEALAVEADTRLKHKAAVAGAAEPLKKRWRKLGRLKKERPTVIQGTISSTDAGSL